MFQSLRTRLEINKLKREEDRMFQMRRSGEDVQFEIENIGYDIEVLQSRSLCRTARMMDIELPDGDDIWDIHKYTGDHFLNTKGRNALRNTIIDERKKYRSQWTERISIVTSVAAALTGLIGVIIGLISVVF